MAETLEKNIEKLEEEIEAKEEFMGAFAHELKTPLTAIIGYADMLRSHKLDEEKSMMSANYIYTEGKRLEPANSMMSVTLRYKEKPIARSVNTSETSFRFSR